MSKKDRAFWESAQLNNLSYLQYYYRLVDLAISVFEWKNLPATIDARFLELCLFSRGQAVFFEDEIMGFLALPNSLSGRFNVYDLPIRRRARASNGYSKNLTVNDSVIIFNNYLHTNSMPDIELFARRLYQLDRTIDININAQKTPILLQCDENQRLTLTNLYKQYDGNMPFIFASNSLNIDGIKVINTGAPYLADKLTTQKIQIWNEALTYLGIPNVNVNKKERLVTDEVSRGMGGTLACRYSRLNSRQQACEQINTMFNLDVWCEYRKEVDEQVRDITTEIEPTESGDMNE